MLPMITATSFSEVLMMLGVWAAAGWQLDLASLAGIIMVIGTGVDQLVIITDELLRGGEAAVFSAQRSIKERAQRRQRRPAWAKDCSHHQQGLYLPLSRAFVISSWERRRPHPWPCCPCSSWKFGSLTGFALIIILGIDPGHIHR